VTSARSSPAGTPSWRVAPIPADEQQRLAALLNLGILDTSPTPCLDRLTRLVAKVLGVPIVLISLVDETRQWFKSRVGFEAAQTPREVSLCAHAVFERRPLVVPDAKQDLRFASNPLVISTPHIRAYLGIPLYTQDEQPIGTLCAIDTRPRSFAASDVDTMCEFAAIAQHFIHSQQEALRFCNDLHRLQDREQIFQATFDQAPVAIAHVSFNGQLVRANPRTCEMLGFTEAELRELSFVDIMDADDIAHDTLLFRRIMNGEIDHYHMSKRFIRKDGEFVWTRLLVTLRRPSSLSPNCLIAFIEDVSEQKRIEQELVDARQSLTREIEHQAEKLRERTEALRVHLKQTLDSELTQRASERRLRAITNSIPAMVGYWTRELRCAFANEHYRAWFGVPEEQIVGMHMSELLAPALFAANEPYARAALTGRAQHFARQAPKLDGSMSFNDVRYEPDIDEDAGVRGFYVLVTDTTELHAARRELEVANAKLSEESTTDYLTGLPNRRVFSEKSEEAAIRAQERGETYGLILLDLDDFKVINDRFGHDIGDEVLQATGRILSGQLRGRDDVAARLGGEEFAILCFGALSETSLMALAERVRAQLNKESIATTKGLISYTSSFGAAHSYPEDAGWKAIYARADSALYEAKAGGKNRVVFGRSSNGTVTGRFRAIRPAR
jgi:diguanylate cyclase (GGDEF)-like protein/PAS domain S-box-containing protein